MTTLSIGVGIAAPPATVWAIMKDVERWHEWTPSITSIRLFEAGPIRQGSRAEVRQPKLPPARWLVTEVEEGTRFTWISRAPGILVTARHGVEASGALTRATLSIHYGGMFGPLLAALTRGINERYIRMEAEGLKRRSEEAGRGVA